MKNLSYKIHAVLKLLFAVIAVVMVSALLCTQSENCLAADSGTSLLLNISAACSGIFAGHDYAVTPALQRVPAVDALFSFCRCMSHVASLITAGDNSGFPVAVSAQLSTQSVGKIAREAAALAGARWAGSSAVAFIPAALAPPAGVPFGKQVSPKPNV
ncbi:MAG: hypothetical protein NC924_00890 [Candidatus Omnitrophica bacterium]|nr:hypothetical protein [Candidatus Omnitrophota bacterium]